MAFFPVSSTTLNVLTLSLCCFVSCIGSRDDKGFKNEGINRARALSGSSTHRLSSSVPIALAAAAALDPLDDASAAASNHRFDHADFDLESDIINEFPKLTLPSNKIITSQIPIDSRSAGSGKRQKRHDSVVADETYSLEVTNDGPVILGSSANFVATLSLRELDGLRDKRKLSDGDDARPFAYRWRKENSTILSYFVLSNSTCKVSMTFNSTAGDMAMEVTVTPEFKPLTILAKATSSIRVTETINGQILTSSTSYPECNTTDSHCSIPTKSNLSLIADIYDPSSYFETAVILFKWKMGNGDVFTTTQPIQVYSYQTPGVYNVTLNITALMKVQDANKYGFWYKNITVLAPLTNLTIESYSTSVEVGKREVVNVTCNGSPPVEICITVQDPGVLRNTTNTTCVSISTERCFTTLTYHFDTLGEYVFQVSAQNNVSFLHNVSSIHAHPPPIPPESITGITLAVLAGLLMTCIAAAAFAQQVRRNQRRHVEVANFDFQFRDRSSSGSSKQGKGFFWSLRRNKSIPLFNRTSTNYDAL